MKYIAWTCFVLFQFLNSYGQQNRVFKSIEDALTVPTDSVYRINLSGDHLKTIPPSLMQFTNLKELDLSRNNLVSLPADFVFPNLEVLTLTKNKFAVFPTAICANTHLKQLLLGKNKLTELPPCIDQLKELVILDIWFNKITEIPETITALKNLRSIDFRGMSYSDDFQKKWIELLPWVKLEFELGCDCG